MAKDGRQENGRKTVVNEKTVPVVCGSLREFYLDGSSIALPNRSLDLMAPLILRYPLS